MTIRVVPGPRKSAIAVCLIIFIAAAFIGAAAFSIPALGLLGNLKRGGLRGPAYHLIDFSIRKEIAMNAEKKKSLSFNVDITNLFNFTNFKSPSAKLESKLGIDASHNELQLNQPFTIDAASNSFGILNRTSKREFDLGSSRQNSVWPQY